MAGLFLLLTLTVVMALASFLAGALPLSMSLSQSQLRLISSIGIGMLMGTSLIVIIPEGIEAVTSASTSHPPINAGGLGLPANAAAVRLEDASVGWRRSTKPAGISQRDGERIEASLAASRSAAALWEGGTINIDQDKGNVDVEPPTSTEGDAPGSEHHADEEVPTFYVGLSLIMGFILMFLIERIPQHASENLQPPAQPRHISLSNLGGSNLAADEEEAAGFLGSLAPTPRQSRSLATTTGLVIHAAADGIALGASSSSSDMKLGFIVFIAILIHKAPAAFGLTSVLLKQGLSKRAARGHLIVFSLAAPVGAWATFLLAHLLGGGGEGADGQQNQWWTGMLLLFSGGTFLYVAMHAMQEGEASSSHDTSSAANGYTEGSNSSLRTQNRPRMRDTLTTVIGMLLPLLTLFGGHDH